MVWKEEAMRKKKNPRVFLDVSINGDPIERIVIEVKLVASLVYLFELLVVCHFVNETLGEHF